MARTLCSVFHICPLLFFCLALGISSPMSSSPPVAGERILFSNVARFGFAAGHDSPALKIEENVPLQNNKPGNNSSNLNGITFREILLVSAKIYGICMFHVQSIESICLCRFNKSRPIIVCQCNSQAKT